MILSARGKPKKENFSFTRNWKYLSTLVRRAHLNIWIFSTLFFSLSDSIHFRRFFLGALRWVSSWFFYFFFLLRSAGCVPPCSWCQNVKRGEAEREQQQLQPAAEGKRKKGYIATARRGGPSRTTRAAAAETQHPQRRTERERRKDLLRWNRLLLSAVCSFLLYSYYYYYYDWIKETAVRAGGCITQSGRPRFFSPPFLGPRYEPFFRSAISFSCLIWLFFFFMSPVNGIKSAMEKPLKPVIDSQWNENKNFFLSFFAAAHPEPRKEMGLFWVSVGQSVRRPSCIILVTRFFSFWERRVGVADADGAQKPTAEDTPSEITQRSSSSSFL